MVQGPEFRVRLLPNLRYLCADSFIYPQITRDCTLTVNPELKTLFPFP